MKNEKYVKTSNIEDKDANRDPITGAPGAHPVGTGVGAAAGGAAGAAIGAAGGPIGAAVGLAAGAIVGGLAGKGAGELVNPTEEETYWREHYVDEPYFDRSRRFEDYHPAYRTGYEGYTRYSGKSYSEVETDLRRDYDRMRGTSALEWEEAQQATRAAWERVDQNLTEREKTGDVAPRYSENAETNEQNRMRTTERSRRLNSED